MIQSSYSVACPRALRRKFHRQFIETLVLRAGPSLRLPKFLLRSFVRKFLKSYRCDRSAIYQCLRSGGKAAALASFLLALLGEARAATPVFTSQTGSSNPANSVVISSGRSAAPALVDIDGDGDLDMFVGTSGGGIDFWKNIGTRSAPNFQLQTGSNNPLAATVPASGDGLFSTVAFVDIDGDGDLDAFVGESTYPSNYIPRIRFIKNNGTATAPNFSEVTGSGNPLGSVTDTSVVAPWDTIMVSFADLDNDGDYDAVVASTPSGLRYYKNTGTATNPVFTQQTGANNPLNGLGGSTYRMNSVVLVDIDGDGDFDVIQGKGKPASGTDGATMGAGFISFFENTGTISSPTFVERTGTANPFNGLNGTSSTAPCPMVGFGDIDNDGDKEAFIGVRAGTILYYRNDTPGANTTPSFVGSTTTLTVDENAAATNIKDLLHVSDTDSSQTLTWSQSSPPTHGTLTFTSATASSGSADVTPGGTITYTPTASYSGSDSFTVRISDGTATATRTIAVTVSADVTAPTIVSITRQTPTSQTVSTSSVVFRVTFSEPVQNVTTSSFTVAAVSGSNIVGTVASVTAVSSSVYDVTANITSGTGAFQLKAISP